MYRELYQYLVLNQQLHIPGIGTFQVNSQPAKTDFPNRVVHPEAYSISLNSTSDSNSRHLFNWLAEFFHISEREAVVRFNDFVFEIKNHLNAGGTIRWKGIGSLSKKHSKIKLSPDPVELTFERPVPAEKVLREKAEHVVWVGESEKTSAEMTEMLAQPVVKRDLWWAYALAVGIITIIFIGWYLSQHGVDEFAIANKQKLTPKSQSASYTELKIPQ